MQKNSPFSPPDLTPLKPASEQGLSASLGIYAKTSAAPAPSVVIFDYVDQQTGEIKKYEVDRKTLTPRELKTNSETRAIRYALKAYVSQILPTSRTSKCLRWTIPHQSPKVCKCNDSQKSFFGGVQVCASVWRCPVCAARITERRKHETQQAIDLAHAKGLKTYLLTLTVPHGLGDDINPMLDRMMTAWRSITKNRAGRSAFESIGRVGFIRALEVTHGKNGFHPHFHILLFLDTLKTPLEVQQTLSPLWQKSCLSAGLPMPSVSHGCRVDNGEKASQYVAKGVWGLASELTKSPSKKSKSADGQTPLDLLTSAAFEGSIRDKKLWLVYAKAFHGRRQLYWSNGLREFLGMFKERTDEEIAAHDDEPSTVIQLLTFDQWQAIIKTHSETLVLDTSDFNPAALPAILESVEARYARMKASPS